MKRPILFVDFLQAVPDVASPNHLQNAALAAASAFLEVWRPNPEDADSNTSPPPDGSYPALVSGDAVQSVLDDPLNVGVFDPLFDSKLIVKARFGERLPSQPYDFYTFGGDTQSDPAAAATLLPTLFTLLEKATTVSPGVLIFSGAVEVRYVKRERNTGLRPKADWTVVREILIGRPRDGRDLNKVDRVHPHLAIEFKDFVTGQPLAEPLVLFRAGGIERSQTLPLSTVVGKASLVLGLSNALGFLYPLGALGEALLDPTAYGSQILGFRKAVRMPDIDPFSIPEIENPFLHLARGLRQAASDLGVSDGSDAIERLRPPAPVSDAPYLRRRCVSLWGQAMLRYNARFSGSPVNRTAQHLPLWKNAMAYDPVLQATQAKLTRAGGRGDFYYYKVGSSGRPEDVRSHAYRWQSWRNSYKRGVTDRQRKIAPITDAVFDATEELVLGHRIDQPIGAKKTETETDVNDNNDVAAYISRMKDLGHTDIVWPTTGTQLPTDEQFDVLYDTLQSLTAIIADIPNYRKVSANTFRKIGGWLGLPDDEGTLIPDHPFARLQPGDFRHRWLVAENAPKWVRFQAKDATDSTTVHHGTGWVKYDHLWVSSEGKVTDHKHHWATDWAIEVIRDAALSYENTYRKSVATAAKVGVGHLSLSYEKTNSHSTHQTGMNIDLRLPPKRARDGDPHHKSGINWWSPDYDQNAARAQLKAFSANQRVSRIYFNDPDLLREGLCEPVKHHDNHIHVRISAPFVKATQTA